MPNPFDALHPNFDQLAQETQIAFAAGQRRVDTFYQQTYPIILRECSKLSFNGSKADFEHLEVCLLLVYSWMSPSRLDKGVRWTHYQNAYVMLDRIRHDGTFSVDNFNDTVRLVNESVVGASKFLHFVAPTDFSIWDQHVARYCGFKYTYQYDSPELYLAYLNWLRGQPISENAVRLTSGLLGVSPGGQQLRCKEFLLFQAGLKLKSAR